MDEATLIRDAFEHRREAFRAVTRRARGRFEDRNWHAAQADAAERLDVFRRVVSRTVVELRTALGAGLADRERWSRLRSAYAALVAGRTDRELAETFFNSVVRRVFPHAGVDPEVEFVETSDEPSPSREGGGCVSLAAGGDSADLVGRVLARFSFRVPWRSPGRDARAAAAVIERAVAGWPGPRPLEAVDLVDSVFYRGKGAYLVGRLRGTGGLLPLVVCLRHEDDGPFVDAVLTDEDSAAIVFSYTRKYFLVDAASPPEVVRFLRTILPAKRLAELYTAIGYNHHGKTELYREMRRHLRASTDRFAPARGERGMVMAVFTMPGFDVVFKVIRDRFPEPKTATRERVMERYELVFRHDRAGRLVDAQSFERLSFSRDRFTPEVLDELLSTAAETVSVVGDRVDVRHLYTERRLTPLNLYLREAPPEAARAAVLDYGQAIRDLAATGVFPGDVLPKNFGVTRHGRVIFYDYDELALLSECRFRELPAPRDPEDETRGEPWFYVAENDVFPEEFLSFLGLPRPLRDAFLEAHRDLLHPRFWREMQERLRAGEILDVFPYRPDQRLPG